MKYNYLNLVIVILLSSCSNDWFDIKSNQRLTIPESLDDYELLLNNFNTLGRYSPGLGEVGSDGHYVNESTWLNSQTPDAYSVSQANAYIWQARVDYYETEDWNRNFAKIANCNMVLSGIEKKSSEYQSDIRFAIIKGNALFLRAKTMLDLAQVYSTPYSKTDSKHGLPILKEINITEKPIRSTVHETYTSIINDLLEAANLLPNLSDNPQKASKASAYTLLARTYLIMYDYQNVKTYAEKGLKLKNTLLDYNLVSIDAPNLGTNNPEILYYNTMVTYYFNLNPYALIDEEIFKMYEENDLRKRLFFESTNDGVVFKGNYSDEGLPSANVCIDELYLLRAEANARLENITAALEDMIHLLEKRYQRNEDGSSTFKIPDLRTKDEVLNFILAERKKQLLFRGLRWLDLRRLNTDTTRKTTIIRNISGIEYQLKPNSYQYTFPIPQNEITRSNMEQNPGW